MKLSLKTTMIIFLTITFALMGITHGIIYLLFHQTTLTTDDGIIQILGIIGGAAPAIGALYIVYKYYSNDEKETYWKAVYRFKTSYLIWAVVLLSPLVLGVVTNYIVNQNLNFVTFNLRDDLLRIPIIFAVSIFAGGAEELGWRGIVQRRLEGSYNLAMIGLFIGVIWGVWHLPLFLIEGFAHYEYNFFIYLLSTIIFSLWMSGVVYKTRSVGLAILMHAAINTSANFGFNIPMTFNLLVVILMVLVIIASIFVLQRFIQQKQ